MRITLLPPLYEVRDKSGRLVLKSRDTARVVQVSNEVEIRPVQVQTLSAKLREMLHEAGQLIALWWRASR